MPIIYDDNSKLFYIQSKNTTYVLGIFDNKYPVHIYYGTKIRKIETLENINDHSCRSFSAVPDNCTNISNNDLLLEFSTYGNGDFRKPTLHMEYEDGSTISDFSYDGYEIIEGKPKLIGLPATYVNKKDEATTLNIKLIDEKTKISVILSYSVFYDTDIITRNMNVINNGVKTAKILSAQSLCLDFDNIDYDFVHLFGAWAKERHIQKSPLINGNVNIESRRFASSHFHNPFFALSEKNATETHGNVYGFALCYSGNFVAGAEADSPDLARVYMGINPFDFRWNLKQNEEFQTPEVIMSFSDDGFGKMSRSFHKIMRKNLVRGKYRDSVRPVLINNWEATYFDFNEEKIINLASVAKKVGIDLLVLDDGWFGKRNDDTSSLGDWYCNKEKLPCGIDGLSKKINDMGMKFGLWVEPEMISPNSDLYRNHPEWVISVDGRKMSLGRNQLMLDLTNKDVCDYIVDAVSNLLKTSNISYIKWDYNRNITEAYGKTLDKDSEMEFGHRYILGLYDIMERLVTSFPDVLFEGCSGGGGRFDAGMLYYVPQIWTSDDTDAIERLYIQYGTSLLYPASSMGAHVSAIPNHQVGRNADINTRGASAMMGRFGYELDITKMSDDELEILKQQVKYYKDIENVIHHGEMYRLISPFEKNEASFEFISEDKTKVIVFYFNILGKPNPVSFKLKTVGLDENADYKLEGTDYIYGGDVLNNIGLTKKASGDFKSEIMIFTKVR